MSRPRGPSRREPRNGDDALLLRRAARSIALQVAFAVAVVVLIMSAAVFYVEERQQESQAVQRTREAWASADDDVEDPPAGIWLVIRGEDGETQTSPGAPDVVRVIDPGALPDGESRIQRGELELALWTGNRDEVRLSAVYDLSPREEQEQRLLGSLALASVLGVAGAVAVGAYIGRRAVRPLGEALVLQRRFVSNASHELRTPLTVLQLRAQVLKRHLARQVSPDQLNELDRLVLDTKVMGEVVNDLLLSAELEHRPQTGEPVDLGAVAGDVVQSLQALARERSVELTLGATAGSGPLVVDLVVNGAAAALRRAVVSLVDNAIAHTPAGGHVVVGAAREERLVVVRVQDDGQGLDPAQSRQLVDRFARGTSSDAGRRFGLGLSLVDEIARAHGGRLEISGARGTGATFSLWVPASEDSGTS